VRAALISDLHLEGGPNDAVQRDFVTWLDQLEVDALYLMGDIFHGWWGFRDVVPARLVGTCAALERVRDRGIAIHVVPGNHDFALGPFFTELLGATVHEPGPHSFDGKVFFLAHGDEADEAPGYRITRWILRGRLFATWMRMLGPSLGWRLLDRMAGASRDHPSDPAPLRARQQDWARTHLEQGAHYVVLGHIHAPGRSEDGRVIHLGGWGFDRTWCLIDQGEPRLVDAP